MSVYGIDDDSEDFTFSMVLSEDKWANLDDAYSDEGSFPVSDLDSGITFQTGAAPIVIYEQMAADGIEFDFSWNSVSLNNEASFG